MSEIDGSVQTGESAFCGACGARIGAAVRFCTACGESQAPFTESNEAPSGGDPMSSAATEMLPAAENRAQAVDRSAKEQRATGIIVAGYICAVLLPLVGAIIGAMQYERNRHGIWIIAVSIAMVVLSIVLTLVLIAMINSSVSGFAELN